MGHQGGAKRPKVDANLPEVSYGTWVTSSYDLLDGADVTEDAGTIPGDLFDELFAPKQAAPEAPARDRPREGGVAEAA